MHPKGILIKGICQMKDFSLIQEIKRPVPDDDLNVGAQGVPEFEESHLPDFFPA